MSLAAPGPNYPLMSFMVVGPFIVSLWIVTLVLTLRWMERLNLRFFLVGAYILFAAAFLGRFFLCFHPELVQL